MNPIINYAKLNGWEKVRFTIIYKNREKENFESKAVDPEDILQFNVASFSALLTHENHDKVLFSSFAENEKVFIDPSKTSIEPDIHEEVIIEMKKVDEN